MRRLLAIEAGVYPAPNVQPLLRRPRPRARELMVSSAENSAQWRVSFRSLLAPAKRGGAKTRTTPQSPARYWLHETLPPQLAKRARRMDRAAYIESKRPRFYNAWPAAERYEALLRVCNNSAPTGAAPACRAPSRCRVDALSRG